VALSKSVASQAKVNLRVALVLTNILVPYPAAITQYEPQLVTYDDDVYVVSPYVTREQRTTVKLSSSVVKTFNELRPTSRRGDELVYGKYLNVEPFASEPMHLHFENNSPFVMYTSIKRDVDVSHWRAELSLEETVVVRHAGATLAGHFSRLDYQRMQAGSASFRGLQAYLPISAADTYFRCEVLFVSLL
jgi:oligosaccharyltransferase complex subunit alpha (ribophorin I)